MQTKFSRSFEFSHSKKQMNAPILPPIEKFPKHAVPNTTIQTENNFGGMTYSAEIQGDTAEGLAEVRKLIFFFLLLSPSSHSFISTIQFFTHCFNIYKTSLKFLNRF